MESRSEGDKLIEDYVECSMSLDAAAHPCENDNSSLATHSEDLSNIPVGIIIQPVKNLASVSTKDSKEPVLGMKFESDEAAKSFYNDYARRLGFSFRVGRSRCSKAVEEVLIMKRFVCSKERVLRKKPSGEGMRKRERMSMREGCKAMMKVIHNSDGWVVSKLEKAHNHNLGTCNRVSYLHARGFVDIATEKADIVASDTATLLPQEAFGEGGDAQSLLDYLNRMQTDNPAFFYSIQVDNDSCVNAFWVDCKARTAYSYFGGTITFDTTYKKNMYMMPFVTFSGINHHLQPVIFGCALLTDGTEFSFIWLFKTWLAAMDGHPPVSLVTDKNRAMAAAITKVFPNTCHRFCKWLILSRSKQKLAHLYSQHTSLRAELEECVKSKTLATFEARRASIIDRYDLRKNSWLQMLFSIRQKWIPLYFKDNFFGEMSSFQKLETMNDFQT